MNKEEREELNRDLFDYTLKSLTQKMQLDQWLINLFYINRSLHLEYDHIYQGSYYIKLYELLTEGLKYAEELKENTQKVDNKSFENWLDILISGLMELRREIPQDEFNFIEYKRHNTCHTFQNKYVIEKSDNGKIKRKPQFQLKEQFYQILDKHGSDRNFDLYITKKLYPVIIFINEAVKLTVSRN